MTDLSPAARAVLEAMSRSTWRMSWRAPMADPAFGYAVMRSIQWEGIEVGGIPMQAPPDGPQRFIPVFDTQEQAVAFASDGDRIMPVRLRSLAAGGQP